MLKSSKNDHAWYSHYGQFENLTNPVGNPYKLFVYFNFFPATPAAAMPGKSERIMTMAPVTKDTILKKLVTLYGSAFHDGKWHTALPVAKRQVKNRGMFEKSYLPEVMRITGMRERQDLTGALEKLDPELTHPPPSRLEVSALQDNSLLRSS